MASRTKVDKVIRRLARQETKQAVRSKQDGRCYYCGQPKSVKQLTWDHKTPESRGGTDAAENLVLACTKCNGDKADLTEAEYREKLRKKVC